MAGLASFMCHAAELPPPQELMLIMAVLAATEIPATASGAAVRSTFTAAGAVFA